MFGQLEHKTIKSKTGIGILGHRVFSISKIQASRQKRFEIKLYVMCPLFYSIMIRVANSFPGNIEMFDRDIATYECLLFRCSSWEVFLLLFVAANDKLWLLMHTFMTLHIEGMFFFLFLLDCWIRGNSTFFSLRSEQISLWLYFRISNLLRPCQINPCFIDVSSKFHMI